MTRESRPNADISDVLLRKDVYKERLKKQIAKWLDPSLPGNSTSIVTALGEVTADIAASLTSAAAAAKMFGSLARQMEDISRTEAEAAETVLDDAGRQNRAGRYKAEIRQLADLWIEDERSDPPSVIEAVTGAAVAVAADLVGELTTAQLLRHLARQLDGARKRKLEPVLRRMLAAADPRWKVEATVWRRTRTSRCVNYRISMQRPLETLIEEPLGEIEGVTAAEAAEQVAEIVREDLFPQLVRAVDEVLRVAVVTPSSVERH